MIQRVTHIKNSLFRLRSGAVIVSTGLLLIAGSYFDFYPKQSMDSNDVPVIEAPMDTARQSSSMPIANFPVEIQKAVGAFDAEGKKLPIPAESAKGSEVGAEEFAQADRAAIEIRMLHARQQEDVDRLLNDINAEAIESNDIEGVGMTVQEVRALHAQQTNDLKLTSETDVAIAATDKTAAVTVAEVRELHLAQERAITRGDRTEEVIVLGDATGAPALTRQDISFLHASQHKELSRREEMASLDYSVPGVDPGTSVQTVEQLRKLHELQSTTFRE